MDVPQIQVSLPSLPALPTVRLPATVSSFAAHLEQAAVAPAPTEPATADSTALPAAGRAAASAATLGAMLRAGAPVAGAMPTSGLVGGLGQLSGLSGTGGLGQVVPSVLGPVGAPSGLFAGHAGVVAPVAGEITSDFGMRVHPITGEHREHHGMDIAAPSGTPVRSITDGVVVRAEDAGGYGLLVEVDHGDGTTSRYAHMQRIDVAVGDRLAVGQQVGAVGSTGRSTGPHLHVEVRRDGAPVDPAGLW